MIYFQQNFLETNRDPCPINSTKKLEKINSQKFHSYLHGRTMKIKELIIP